MLSITPSGLAWFGIDRCVWDAPEWQTRLEVLARNEVYRPLGIFFRDVLGVRNFKWQDAIDELVFMHETTPDIIDVRAIYEYLASNFQHDSTYDELRYALNLGKEDEDSH